MSRPKRLQETISFVDASESAKHGKISFGTTNSLSVLREESWAQTFLEPTYVPRRAQQRDHSARHDAHKKAFFELNV